MTEICWESYSLFRSLRSSRVFQLIPIKRTTFIGLTLLFAVAFTARTVLADANTKKHAPGIAKAAGNDQQSFSLILEPDSHPFCKSGETESDGDRQQERNIRPLLVPDSCSQQSGSKNKYDWDLASDPLVPKEWPSIKADDACLDGKADVLLERAYRYGFCDWTQYDFPLNSVKAAAKKFALTDADYYAIHVVVWKGDASFDKTKVVSSFHGMNPDQDLPFESDVVITSTDPQTGSSTEHKYEFKTGVLTKNVLSTMTADLKTKDGAKVENGQIIISLPPNTSVKGTGVLTTWVAPITSVSYKVGSSRWYTYNRGDHRRFRQPLPMLGPESLRIYGTKRPIGLVAVHIRPVSDDGLAEHDRELWEDFKKLKIKYQISVKKKVAANVADLTGAVSIIFNKAGGVTAATVKGTEIPEGVYGATFFKAKSPSDITMDVQIDFPATPKENPAPAKEKPQAVTNAESSYRSDSLSEPMKANKQSRAINRPHFVNTAYKIENAADSDAKQTTNPQQPTAGGGSNPPKTTTKNTGQSPKGATQDQTPTAPSVDCQPSTGNSQQSACKMEAKYDAEDLYHWDISFGVPFKSLKELTYGADTGNGSIVPKTVKRQYAYVFADIYPIAADIVSPPWITMPHFMAGLPISGKVFNKPIFAIGDGFNLKKIRYLNAIPLQVQFFGGVAFNKEFRQIPGTTGSSNVAPHRVWSGIYGIEIPVSQFKGLLGSKNSSTNQPSSKNPSTGTGGQSN